MSERKVLVTTVNDKEFTFTGEAVEFIERYLESGLNAPMGWVAVKGQGAVNFNHVVSIVFEELKGDDDE